MKETAIILLCGMALLFPLSLSAQEAKDGEKYIYIPTDKPLPPSAEEVVPKSPFFSESSTGSEAFEAVQELKRRVDKLEGVPGVITQKPDGTLVIEAKGPIEIRTPSTIKLDAKSVEMPTSDGK